MIKRFTVARLMRLDVNGGPDMFMGFVFAGHSKDHLTQVLKKEGEDHAPKDIHKMRRWQWKSIDFVNTMAAAYGALNDGQRLMFDLYDVTKEWLEDARKEGLVLDGQTRTWPIEDEAVAKALWGLHNVQEEDSAE